MLVCVHFICIPRAASIVPTLGQGIRTIRGSGIYLNKISMSICNTENKNGDFFFIPVMNDIC